MEKFFVCFCYLWSLLAIPAGLFTLWSAVDQIHVAHRMSHWWPVQATLIDAGVYEYEDNGAVDDNGRSVVTYEAYADYSYKFYGVRYTGNRVGVASGSDNIGDYQQQLGARLRSAMERDETITVWVDPNDPSQSIIDRHVRLGVIVFLLFGGLLFSGVGLTILVCLNAAQRKGVITFGEPTGAGTNQYELPVSEEYPLLLPTKSQAYAREALDKLRHSKRPQ